jgi:hypothetical protein
VIPGIPDRCSSPATIGQGAVESPVTFSGIPSESEVVTISDVFRGRFRCGRRPGSCRSGRRRGGRRWCACRGRRSRRSRRRSAVGPPDGDVLSPKARARVRLTKPAMQRSRYLIRLGRARASFWPRSRSLPIQSAGTLQTARQRAETTLSTPMDSRRQSSSNPKQYSPA